MSGRHVLSEAKSSLTRPGVRIGDSRLESQLRRELEGEVLFDAFERGRYSTDASIYQIEPLGVVVPRHREDVVRAVQIAADEGISVLPRRTGCASVRDTRSLDSPPDSSLRTMQSPEDGSPSRL